jgi:hypothetical protein
MHFWLSLGSLAWIPYWAAWQVGDSELEAAAVFCGAWKLWLTAGVRRSKGLRVKDGKAWGVQQDNIMDLRLAGTSTPMNRQYEWGTYVSTDQVLVLTCSEHWVYGKTG